MSDVQYANDELTLLSIEGLTIEYPGRRRSESFVAVNDVSLDIRRNETLGLVGESGSGKSTIGKAILGMAPATSGTITFDGRAITHLSDKDRRSLSAELQVVFQDPVSSLNPTRTIGQTLGESLRHRSDFSTKQVQEAVVKTLGQVGMAPSVARRYPGDFSGGQRQRIAIARAIIGRPKLVICDEPTSALDLSVQAQVLNLLDDLQTELGLGYLFISHDLEVVRHVADRIAVLYRGRVVEYGDASQVYSMPAHPYTRALLEAAPIPDPVEQRRRSLRRQSVAPTVTPVESGCAFAPRCPLATDHCRAVVPCMQQTPCGVSVACHRWPEAGELGSVEHA